MADFMQGLDPGKLVLAGAVLSFILSPFAAPTYNLPIFLFGMLVHESSDAMQSLKLFTGLLPASILFDIIWAFNNDQGTFTKFILFLLWLLKFPTAMTFLNALRQRGSQFMGLGADVNGPTVWSMPGGFTSSARDGYQIVDDEPRSSVPPARHGGPPPPPKSMTPTTTTTTTVPIGGSGVAQGPGTYQSA